MQFNATCILPSSVTCQNWGPTNTTSNSSALEAVLGVGSSHQSTCEVGKEEAGRSCASAPAALLWEAVAWRVLVFLCL